MEEQKKKPKVGVRTSLWFVTINTNIPLQSKSQEEANKVIQMFDEVLEEILPRFGDFLEIKNSKTAAENGFSDAMEDLCSPQRILEKELKYATEIAPNGRLHAHISFRLKKRGVDTKLITARIKTKVDEIFSKKSGTSISCYVNYRLCASTDTLENYMMKSGYV